MAKSPKKVKEPSIQPVPSVQPEPSQDLVEKVNALKGLINIHDLLNQGQYQGHMSKRLQEAMELVSKLHAALLEETKNHPESHLIKGL